MSALVTEDADTNEALPAPAPQAAKAPPPRGPDINRIFGSFWIDKTEFALPVSAIREVVKEPENISRVPLAPPFLCGLFNLRGMIIPIMDLRILLEFPDLSEADAAAAERKVAIIYNGETCIGLLFDHAGEVLNDTAGALVSLREKKGDIKDVVIDGVLKLDGGNRMVQILDPYEILRIERVPQAEAEAFATGQKRDLGSRRSCVSFQLGHTCCAIDLRYVQEVRDMPPVESSWLANGFVIGTVNLRGDVIPVVDFRSFMGNEAAFKLSDAALARRKLLIIKTEGGLIGLMVYSIDSIIPFFKDDVLPFAKLALPRGNIVRGCLVSESEQLVMLLDHAQLLSDPGLSEPARTCQQMHHPDPEAEKAEKAETAAQVLERRTFIMFSVSSSFAMDTCAVSEVINKPDKLLEPPYALSFVEGIINLRGELITLINLRKLYGLDEIEAEAQKVLIFFHEDKKYAILVDSVDEIVMTNSDQVSDNRVGTFSEAVGSAPGDVSGVLNISRDDSDKAYVLIMNVAALMDRCIGAK